VKCRRLGDLRVTSERDACFRGDGVPVGLHLGVPEHDHDEGESVFG
jgi:hypothetical protein